MCLLRHLAIWTYGGVEVQPHTLLISALYGSEESASHPSALHKQIKPPVPTEQEVGEPQSWSGH
jgi:hypothetical protein